MLQPCDCWSLSFRPPGKRWPWHCARRECLSVTRSARTFHLKLSHSWRTTPPSPPPPHLRRSPPPSLPPPQHALRQSTCSVISFDRCMSRTRRRRILKSGSLKVPDSSLDFQFLFSLVCSKPSESMKVRARAVWPSFKEALQRAPVVTVCVSIVKLDVVTLWET